MLPESKVKDFLHEASFSSSEGATRDQRGLVKDNEQVSYNKIYFRG